MKFLILGGNGMAGHIISQYLKEQNYDITVTTRKQCNFQKNIIWDGISFAKLKKIIIDNNYDFVVNCIGILNTYANQNPLDAEKLNTKLPHFLVEITKDMKTKIIHLSTDCVFSGEKEFYTENSKCDGKTIYDITKANGEFNDLKNLVFRNSIIGPDVNKDGIGLFNWFMTQNHDIDGYDNWYWNGVTTLTLAKAIEQSCIQNLTGLYHLVPTEKISKYNLLLILNKYRFNKIKISKKQLSTPINKFLINTRNDFNFYIPTYDEMIKEMFEWIENHKSLYNYNQ